jgi:hypothetical protein
VQIPSSFKKASRKGSDESDSDNATAIGLCVTIAALFLIGGFMWYFSGRNDRQRAAQAERALQTQEIMFQKELHAVAEQESLRQEAASHQGPELRPHELKPLKLSTSMSSFAAEAPLVGEGRNEYDLSLAMNANTFEMAPAPVTSPAPTWGPTTSANPNDGMVVISLSDKIRKDGYIVGRVEENFTITSDAVTDEVCDGWNGSLGFLGSQRDIWSLKTGPVAMAPPQEVIPPVPAGEYLEVQDVPLTEQTVPDVSPPVEAAPPVPEPVVNPELTAFGAALGNLFDKANADKRQAGNVVDVADAYLDRTELKHRLDKKALGVLLQDAGLLELAASPGEDISVDALLGIMDVDSDGKISREEFVTNIYRRHRSISTATIESHPSEDAVSLTVQPLDGATAPMVEEEPAVVAEEAAGVAANATDYVPSGETQKLTHATLSRPKGPPKRPPSRGNSTSELGSTTSGGLPVLEKVNHSENLTERERIAASVDINATNNRLEEVKFDFSFK